MDHWPIPGVYKLIIGLKRVKVMYQLTKIDGFPVEMKSVSNVSSRPESIAKALKKCEYKMYPNLSVILMNDGIRAVTTW